MKFSPTTRTIFAILAVLQITLPALYYLKKSFWQDSVGLVGRTEPHNRHIHNRLIHTVTFSRTNSVFRAPEVNFSGWYSRRRYVDILALPVPRLLLPRVEPRNEKQCVRVFEERFVRYCEGITDALENSTAVTPDDNKTNPGGDQDSFPYCSCFPETLSGRRVVKLSFEDTLENISVTMAEIGLDPGGRWSPQDCRARQRVAVIIPYRDRRQHLEILLRTLHPVLQRQQLEYMIFVVEQREPAAIFNKGMLMNAGFLEILRRYGPFDCYVFNDVDLIPEDDRNIYSCTKVPRHMGAYISKFKYTLCCGGIFGGATAFTAQQFIAVNGYSNEFYGWGGEDDDMLFRIRSKNLGYIRYPRCVSRYTMIKHKTDPTNPRNPRRKKASRMRPDYYRQVGLNSVKYTVIDVKYLPLYTWLQFDLPDHIKLPDNTTVPQYIKNEKGLIKFL